MRQAIFSRTSGVIGAFSNHSSAAVMLSKGWSTEYKTRSSPSPCRAQFSGGSENIPAVVIATLRRMSSAGLMLPLSDEQASKLGAYP